MSTQICLATNCCCITFQEKVNLLLRGHVDFNNSLKSFTAFLSHIFVSMSTQICLATKCCCITFQEKVNLLLRRHVEYHYISLCYNCSYVFLTFYLSRNPFYCCCFTCEINEFARGHVNQCFLSIKSKSNAFLKSYPETRNIYLFYVATIPSYLYQVVKVVT